MATRPDADRRPQSAERTRKSAPDLQALCLECGMCCDGTIFADVKLSPADMSRIAPSAAIGIGIIKQALKQPCPGWTGGACAIYRKRPEHCRNFDCALLQKVISARTAPERALNTIRSCRRKAEKVRSLLRQLGDRNEHLAVMTRFRNTLFKREVRASHQSASERDLLAQLTVAAHNLSRTLARHFYP